MFSKGVIHPRYIDYGFFGQVLLSAVRKFANSVTSFAKTNFEKLRSFPWRDNVNAFAREHGERHHGSEGMDCWIDPPPKEKSFKRLI